jgi:hypothetical protein
MNIHELSHEQFMDNHEREMAPRINHECSCIYFLLHKIPHNLEYSWFIQEYSYWHEYSWFVLSMNHSRLFFSPNIRSLMNNHE